MLVPKGPLAYHRSIRMLGPLVALVPPAIMLAAMFAARTWLDCGGVACGREVLTGWVLPALALPTAVLWGLPIEDGTIRIVGVLASSAVVWMLLGFLATRRATRSLVATWRNWWSEYLFLLVAVWVGVAGGLYLLSRLVSNGLGGLL